MCSVWNCSKNMCFIVNSPEVFNLLKVTLCQSNLEIGLTLWTRVVCMQPIHGCVRNLSGPHADQNMFFQEKLTYPTGLHVDHHVNGVVYITEPSSHYFNCFYLLHCKCGTNSTTDNSKADPKWRKLSWRAK